MVISVRELSELTPNPRNVRKHNKRQIEEMARSVEAFGVIRPIVIDEKNNILCGHGLYEALMFLNRDSAECAVVSGLTEKEKKKLMLADNKVYDLGTNDYDAIDELLKEFGRDGDFSVPGFDADYLEDLYGIKSLKGAGEELAAAMPSSTPQNDEFGSGGANTSQTQENPPTPSSHVQEERQRQLEGRRVLVCPHCGEIIEV